MFTWIASASVVLADFAVVIGNGNGVASTSYFGYQGQTNVTIPVFGYSPSGNNGLDAFSLSLDFGSNQGAPGYGLPTGFSAGTFGIAGGGTPLNGAQSLNTTSAPFVNGFYPGQVSYDFIANGSHSTTFPLSTDSMNPTKLFDLVFDIGGSAVPGFYAINLILDTTIVDPVNGDVPNQTVIAPASLGTLSAFNGSIQVLTAVPEPTSLAGLLSVGMAGVFYRKRRAPIR